MDDWRTFLSADVNASTQNKILGTHTSKLSFHAGLNDLLTMAVVLVCSPSTVRTAKGSGRLSNSRFARPEAFSTERVEVRRRLKIQFKTQHTVHFDGALGIIQSW